MFQKREYFFKKICILYKTSHCNEYKVGTEKYCLTPNAIYLNLDVLMHLSTLTDNTYGHLWYDNYFTSIVWNSGNLFFKFRARNSRYWSSLDAFTYVVMISTA